MREDSLHMLHVLSQREWGVNTGGKPEPPNRMSSMGGLEDEEGREGDGEGEDVELCDRCLCFHWG